MDGIGIIPKPVRATATPGRFRLQPGVCIHVDEQTRRVGEYLKGLLDGAGVGLALSGDTLQLGRRGFIVLGLNSRFAHLGREGYALSVSPDSISIQAQSPVGIFHGVQSLRQLLPPEVEDAPGNVEWSLPCVEIEDTPRFTWRGYMLDVGRHFHGKETVKKIIDVLALQKMNVLHWHLTEDQGWRIEIKRYPRLTEIGSKRNDTQVGGFLSKQTAGEPHAGFYTQEDVREIVAYAAERFVTVVPEIEMPGHSTAALAAYPELSCTGGPFEVAERFGIFKDVYCAGKESVFEFIQGVLDEVVDLFPSAVIHVGGDEVPRKRWNECPDCQARIRAEGLADVHALQRYFTNRIATYLADHGRRLMGWNEILTDGLAENAIGHYWMRGRRNVLEHIRRGRDMVMSGFQYAYLDHDYDFTSLRKAYAYEPIPKGLPAGYHGRILGLEALLWTEWVATTGRLHWQTFPRLTAFAETGWTPREQKDYADFEQRLAGFLRRLDVLGVGYASQRERESNLLRKATAISRIAKAPTGGSTRD